MQSTFRAFALLAVALAALTLAACGSSSSGGSGGKSDEEKQLAFQDCLRDEGLDVQTSPDGRGMAIRAEALSDAGSARVDRDGDAFEKCRKKTGWSPRPPSEEEQAEMRDRALRFSRCMREHGVDMPDPQQQGGGGMTMRLDVDPDSPTFRAASRACGGGMFSTARTAPAP